MDDFISQYEYVQALSINWAHDADDNEKEAHELVSMKEQSQRLMAVFRRYYNVEVEEFQIPRYRAHRALSTKLLEVQEALDDQKNFLILYYGGHGGVDRTRHAWWKWYT